MRRSAGSGTAGLPVALQFTNTGTVEVQTGTFGINGTGSTSSGVLSVAGGTTLTLDGTARGRVEVSRDGEGWNTVLAISPAETWAPLEIDLRAYAGGRVLIRFVVEDAEGTAIWRLAWLARK